MYDTAWEGERKALEFEARELNFRLEIVGNQLNIIQTSSIPQ